MSETTEYFCEDDGHPDEIRAALDAGLAEPWRVDGNNVQWYRRQKSFGQILGVPPEPVRPPSDMFARWRTIFSWWR